MKIIITIAARTILGLLIGTVCGTVICALIFALLEALFGGSVSLGGIATTTNPIRFSATIGAIAGACYGTILGLVIGLVDLGAGWGTITGIVVGALIAAWLFLGARESSGDSALLWIIAIGAILGFIIGLLSRLMFRRLGIQRPSLRRA